jgi:dTDP-glucose pyrophosphorylase
MLNIVIPMAGAGSRFAIAGYEMPKPLIDVSGQTMIEVVINNLRPSCPHRFIFICQTGHIREFGLEQKLRNWAPGCEIVAVDGVTQGAACTVLAAKHFINNDDALMIANSDQFIEVNVDDYLGSMGNFDGLIMTMKANDPKWSYVGFGPDGSVESVVEKKVISNDATVGIYNFAKGCEFVSAALAMIDADIRTNGEFYVAPVYNMMIRTGARIGIFGVGQVGVGMHGLGTPEDLAAFLHSKHGFKAAT